jgi:type IV pilus assembly protein PilM
MSGRRTSTIDKIMGVLRDPPPEFAFEIGADVVAMVANGSRTRPPAAFRHVPLLPGTLVPSPVKENVLNPAAFAEAVRSLIPPATGRGRRGATLILPDNSVRIAVLDFDNLPEKEEERRPLINFRLRKTVPFDIDEAALSYFPQGDLSKGAKKVIVALAPSEIVAHYEAPFRAAGLHPGLVTVSSLAMLELLPTTGSLVVARHSPGVLTVIAVANGIVTIARSIELGDDPEEITAAIYPTLAYIEDQSGARPDKLFISGFEDIATLLSVDLEIPVEAILEPYPGLAGYLAATTPKKAAA